MPQPPPFVLPPDGLGSRVRALLAGAGRQRVAIALLALAALVGGGFVWARATPRLAGTTTGQEAVAPSDQTLPRAAPDTSSTTAPSDEVAVHVAGRVRRPGLVRLPAGSRVQDAIRAAGGVTSGADLNAINLARKLTDGELITVGVPAAVVDGGPAGPLNLNTATVEQLQELPGVGPVLAARIVDYRQRQGGFRSVEELLNVAGIGDAKYAELASLVTV